MTSKYRGRFAPTPSGPLHLGSLLTALASYLQARSQGGDWLLRIDDLDTPRNVAGADTEILQQLAAHGLEWDEAPRYQSRHVSEYTEALSQLSQQGRLYGCICTRAELAQSAALGPDGPVYAGTCRTHAVSDAHALRVQAQTMTLSFEDGWQGVQQRAMSTEVGDFVVRRSDGQIAYQLACAIDEAQQRISEVVRGSDLLGSTFRQRYLQQLLQLPSARYRHLPVLVDAQQLKLSKQNHAPPITAADAPENLFRCLQWLHQAPPVSLQHASVAEIQAWAQQHWTPANVPRRMSLTVE